MFIAALFTIDKEWKQCKCLYKDKWIKKIYIYTIGYYSALKKKEILPYVTTWMNLRTLC